MSFSPITLLPKLTKKVSVFLYSLFVFLFPFIAFSFPCVFHNFPSGQIIFDWPQFQFDWLELQSCRHFVRTRYWRFLFLHLILLSLKNEWSYQNYLIYVKERTQKLGNCSLFPLDCRNLAFHRCANMSMKLQILCPTGRAKRENKLAKLACLYVKLKPEETLFVLLCLNNI